MKNVTVTLDDALYEQSRELAAQRKTTVTELVRDYLRDLSEQDVQREQDVRREQARREILEMIGTFGGEVGRMPSREERNARR